MKKVLNISFIFILCLLSINVNATCNNNELNEWAEKLNIKMVQVTDQYLIDNNFKEEDIPFSYLLMLNIPRNDLKVVAKDTYSQNEYDVQYDSNFKNHVIGSEVHFIDKEYKITVYMDSDAENCANEKMKTIKYTVPKYNDYNDTVYCEDNPDDEICGAYTDVSDNKKEEIEDKIDDYYEEVIEDELFKTKTWYEKTWIIIKEYALFVLIPLIIISIVYIIRIKIIKKKGELK